MLIAAVIESFRQLSARADPMFVADNEGNPSVEACASWCAPAGIRMSASPPCVCVKGPTRPQCVKVQETKEIRTDIDR